jgi:hypothetical protein
MSDPIYTAQQINIPPELPEILKQFTKAAIKTQPSDLTLWAAQFVILLQQEQHPPPHSPHTPHTPPPHHHHDDNHHHDHRLFFLFILSCFYLTRP